MKETNKKEYFDNVLWLECAAMSRGTANSFLMNLLGKAYESLESLGLLDEYNDYMMKKIYSC